MLIRILVLLAVVIVCMILKMRKVLPPATEKGLNTFGVKVDGKVWLPRQPFNVIGGPKVLHAYMHDHVLGIVARKGFSDLAVTLIIPDVRSPGDYRLKGKTEDYVHASKYDRDLIDDEYFPFPEGYNEVRITKLDTVNKIVAGTFRVQLKGKDGSIMDLTDGVFDVRYGN
jgi:hypothetical protein